MNTKRNNNYPLPFTQPEDVGFSSEKLAQIGPGLQKYIDRKWVPNLVTLVARHGKIVYQDARGYTDFDTMKPVNMSTMFRLYSSSKPVAGVAAMILCEEGKLDLEDAIYRYIPAFKHQTVMAPKADQPEPSPAIIIPAVVPANRGITIRDCLRNTTGLPTPTRMPLIYLQLYKDELTTLGMYPGTSPGSLDDRERAEAYARLPLSFQPGTDFEYHVGYPILSVVLEMVAGQPLEEFYRERIFKPLGMNDTSFFLPKSKLDRFPPCHTPRKDGQEWKLDMTERPEKSPKVARSHKYCDVGGDIGGLISTAGDYARFCQMLLNGGELDGVRIISRKSVEMMTANHIGDIHNPYTGKGFGFGLGVSPYKGGAVRPIWRSIGSFFWSGAAGTICNIDPKEEIVYVCFTQVLLHLTIPGNFFQEEFERMVYQALL